MLTARQVIEKIDAFWGTGHERFKEQLEKREIPNFCRAISDIIEDAPDLSKDCVQVVSMGEFEKIMASPP